MGTDFWYPEEGDRRDMGERRRAQREKVVDMLAEIRKDLKQNVTDTAEIKQALFGPKGQEYMGFIPQTEIRLQSVEKKIWTAAVGTIGALLGTAWQLLRRI